MLRKELEPARKKLQMESRYIDKGRYDLDVSCCLAISGDVSSCIVFQLRIPCEGYISSERYYGKSVPVDEA